VRQKPGRNDLYELLAEGSADGSKPIAAALLETLDDPRFANLRAILLDELHLIPGGVVLEVGCGPAVLLDRLYERVTSDGSIHGLDLNPHFIEVAERRAELLDISNSTFSTGDCHELPYRNEMFDAIVGEKLLMHVAPLGPVLEEMKRVLVPGGRLVVADYDPYTIMAAGPDPAVTARIMASAARVYASPMASRETAHTCREVGFEVETVRGYLQVFEDPDIPTVAGVPEVWSDHAAAGRQVEPGTARRWLSMVELAAREDRFMIAIPYVITVAVKPMTD
jgi:ubiquinone/menaquinone biosynthesis C-methylase UbiE